LLSKTALVLLMVTLGALGQRWVRRHARAESGAAPRVARIRRSVGVEAALALVVLAVTAALVETTPARSAYAPMFVGRATVIGEIDVEVQVEPARAGVNAMHVYFTGAGGKAVDVEEVRAVLIHARSGDRVDVDVPRDSLGHYEQLRVALPASGDWRLDLFTRTSDIQSTTSTFTIPVR
jgi:copper transport protein